MELRARLAALLAVRPDWYRAVLSRLAVQLNATAREHVLAPGAAMPDFVLPNADGELVFSDDLLACGPLVVLFFRGGWCPFCMATLQSWQESLPGIRSLGATVVAITPDANGFAAAASRSLKLGYEVLSDLDSAVGLRFGNVYRAPDEYRAALLSFGIDLAARHGDDAGLLPLPSTFIADRRGILRYSHASGDVTDRADPEALLAVLRDLG